MNRFVLLDGKPVVVYPTENQTIPSSYPYFQPPYNYLLGSVFTLLSIWSVLGNLLVLLIVTRYKRMRTRTNILLANLATIDLMTGLLAVPFSAITAFNGGWVLGETACQVNGFLNALFAAASIHSLMYISIHKYWSTKNIFSDGSPVRRIIVMISAAWIWGLLFGTALVTGWTRIEYKTGTTQCGPKNPERGNAREVSHSILTSSTNFLIPLLVILYCYTAVFRIFRRSVSRLVEQDYWQSLSEKHLLARQRKIAITLIIIFVAFLLCLAPYIAYSTTIALFKDKTRVPSVFNPVASFRSISCMMQRCSDLIKN
ncbi:hypothetical protein RvY_02311-2 [Ramazzottius varieornatus]|uniref:G-protein coupled receptors family 1 profile domain-containing protein n=1 Tax=Ramazzottius varieornatus TaxID=947166 RepID=A0A1D1UTV2_RAMVA|nr:hypothetical protein RvY_02311-2 [Ramazzottius varieornatus]